MSILAATAGPSKENGSSHRSSLHPVETTVEHHTERRHRSENEALVAAQSPQSQMTTSRGPRRRFRRYVVIIVLSLSVLWAMVSSTRLMIKQGNNSNNKDMLKKDSAVTLDFTLDRALTSSSLDPNTIYDTHQNNSNSASSNTEPPTLHPTIHPTLQPIVQQGTLPPSLQTGENETTTTTLAPSTLAPTSVMDTMRDLPAWKIAFRMKEIGAASLLHNISERPDASLQRLRVPLDPIPNATNVTLLNKPVIAIITSTVSKDKQHVPVVRSLLCEKLLQSIVTTVGESERDAWHVHVYVALDDTDTWWLDNWDKVGNAIGSNTAPIDETWLSITFAVFPTRPGNIPFNEIAYVAYEEGAEYFYRVNDDTEFVSNDWITKAVTALQSFDPPNIGVVAPVCGEGNTGIMTHDFVHRTHMDIFNGHYYPPVFDNWFLDDWISNAYSAQVFGPNFHRAAILPDWRVKHWVFTTRYSSKVLDGNWLASEYERGRQSIKSYLDQNHPQKAAEIPTSWPTSQRLHSDVVDAILKVLPPNGNLLVWGIDGDSQFWHQVTSGGVIFLYPTKPYPMEHLGTFIPYLVCEPASYSVVNGKTEHHRQLFLSGGQNLTQNKDWCQLKMQFPASVMETVWDAILVAAPETCTGPSVCTDDSGPGIWEALYAAHDIAARSARANNITSSVTHVFVKHYDRPDEQEFSHRLFGSEPDAVIQSNVSEGFQEVAHFTVGPDADIAPSDWCAPSMSFPPRPGLTPWRYPIVSEMESSGPIQSPDLWVILLEVNTGYYDFFRNWLDSFDLLNITIPVVVVALDSDVEQLLMDEVVPWHTQLTVQRDNSMELGNTTVAAAAVDWGTSSFFSLVSRRPWHIHAMLETGYNVIYTDVDTVWQSNPLPYLYATTQEVQMVLSVNLPDYEGYQPFFAADFMAIVASNDTLRFVSEWGTALKQEAEKKPQGILPMLLNRILVKHGTLRHQPLPIREFPNGDYYFNQFPVEIQSTTVVVHNGHLAGHDAKRKRFEEFGLWKNATADS